MVIVDCQRLGPATGGATTGAQGDVQFIRWGTSGGYPIIALAPSTVPECYALTIHAFNLAERFRVPVFIVTDKEMVMTTTTVETDAYESVPITPRRYAPAQAEFVPYHVKELDDVPPMSPYGGPHIVRLTTSTHDEFGYLTKDPPKVDRLNRHLAAKIDAHTDEIAMVKADLEPGAKTVLVSYGITARSMAETVQLARADGHKVSALTVLSLWPVPEKALAEALRGVERVVVAELNLGQYRLEVERIAALRRIEVVGVHRVDGELIAPSEILASLR
jgi:2-oxoglutarate ferredoxin oxidoreductase subunit alpha